MSVGPHAIEFNRSNELLEEIATIRPELLPLCNSFHQFQNYKWEVSKTEDAINLCETLHKLLLNSPELNHFSPCFKSRSIILINIKLSYLSTFTTKEIESYSQLGEKEYAEVQLMKSRETINSNEEWIDKLAIFIGFIPSGVDYNKMKEFAVRALPIAEPTEILLTKGSDDRSIIDPNKDKRNKYYTSSIPCCNIIKRSSCTSSFTSMRSFQVAEKIRQKLLLAALENDLSCCPLSNLFSELMEKVRYRIIQALNIENEVKKVNCHLILTPSGSDAELLTASAALCRLKSLYGRKEYKSKSITSIITASNEVGSGSAEASIGRHFSNLSPSGKRIKPKKSIKCFPKNIFNLLQFPLRNKEGKLDYKEDIIQNTIKDILDNKIESIVVLHLVLGTKTGIIYPSIDLIDQLSKIYNKRLIIVIDACQMRLSRSILKEFILKKFIVLITGSKFFTGAPFCGGIFLPSLIVEELETCLKEEQQEQQEQEQREQEQQEQEQEKENINLIPIGFQYYFCKDEYPLNMPNMRKHMSQEQNIGLLLRWETALLEMETFQLIPEISLESICKEYINEFKRLIKSYYSFIYLLENDQLLLKDELIGNCNTIISFGIQNPFNKKELLKVKDLKFIHKLLSQTLLLKNGEKQCILGQPVELSNSSFGVLRIALGADMINDIFYYPECTKDKIIQEDRIILNKIQCILEHWNLLHDLQKQQEQEQAIEKQEEPAIDKQEHKEEQDNSYIMDKKNIPIILELLCRYYLPLEKNSLPFSSSNMILYDYDALMNRFQYIQSSFPNNFKLYFSMEICPFAFLIEEAIKYDFGLSCCSFPLVLHALNYKCSIAYYNTFKTKKEMIFCLKSKVDLNVGSFNELNFIKEQVKHLALCEYPEPTPHHAANISQIGVHVCLINQKNSNYGIILTKENKEKIISHFQQEPWLCGLHIQFYSSCSSSCSSFIEIITLAANELLKLADQIDQIVGTKQIQFLSFRGGLLSSYNTCSSCSSCSINLANLLKKSVPKLFKTNRNIRIEFGSNITTPTAWNVSKVEDIIKQDNQKNLLIFQKMPKQEFNNLLAFRYDGSLITGKEYCYTLEDSNELTLPEVKEGDFIVTTNTGSSCSFYSIESCPSIYGYNKMNNNSFQLKQLKQGNGIEKQLNFYKEKNYN